MNIHTLLNHFFVFYKYLLWYLCYLWIFFFLWEYIQVRSYQSILHFTITIHIQSYPMSSYQFLLIKIYIHTYINVVYIYIYIYTKIPELLIAPFPTRINPLSPNIFSNELEINVAINQLIKPPFCFFTSFLIVLATRFSSKHNSSNMFNHFHDIIHFFVWDYQCSQACKFSFE